MTLHRNPRLSLAILAALSLTACSTTALRDQSADTESVSSAPTVVSTEPEANPYDTIEQANITVLQHEQDIAVDPVVTPEVQAPPETPKTIWQRFQAEASFPACTPGSDSHDWAQWYGERQDYMDRVFHRAEPWLHDIMNELQARQLPVDLAWLPVVESAFDPFATSRGRAVGTWQFVRGTARDFGLTVNDWYDGRRDVYAATRAALDYLQYLFTEFNNDWEIALAAYNGGQNRVKRALKRYRGKQQNPRPEDLRLPRETRTYAPKLHGLSCLIREPEAFGLKLPDIMDESRVTAVTFDGPLDLIVASRLAELDVAELYALNPGFSRWATAPKGPHRLILPVEHVPTFEKHFAELPAQDRIRWQSIVVQSGDTLSTIAARAGISVNELMAANNLRSSLIRPGQELRLLGGEKSSPGQFDGQEYQQQLAALQKLQGRLLPGEVLEHRVRSGESLWVIARHYKVSVKDLARWNGINDARRIHPGQRLRVLNEQPALGASTSLAANASAPSEHRVRRGDSPWTIARRYRIKLQDLLRWNNLNNNSILRPGQTLRLSPDSGRG